MPCLVLKAFVAERDRERKEGGGGGIHIMPHDLHCDAELVK